ncbi:N-6 DNA methylase [Paenibacillus ehimensis]|uniref:N-6 DNA methylase n=1 Tax=Paenibacillus ehimensis TaxID=79264 RepID=UPI00046EF79E|nr:N-6 DNA methylase [Paenibacillus ehimensis]
MVFESSDTLLIEEDALGRVYEYFLGKFALMLGQGGGEFYTPSSVVKQLVEMIEPYEDAETRSLAMMNLAIRGIEANLGNIHDDTFMAINSKMRNLKWGIPDAPTCNKKLIIAPINNGYAIMI